MTVLADTHALVWALSDPALLSAAARQALADSEVFVSVASAAWPRFGGGAVVDCDPVAFAEASTRCRA